MLRAGALVVNGLCEQFFSGSAFTRDQHGQVCLRKTAGRADGSAKASAVTDKVVEAVPCRRLSLPLLHTQAGVGLGDQLGIVQSDGRADDFAVLTDRGPVDGPVFAR